MPQSVLPPRLRRSQSIADTLAAQIHAGHYAVGAQLPTEALLCQQFQVSRTTLREAIQMLRTHGLVNVTPGRGSFVQAPNPQALLADTLQACASLARPVEYASLLGTILQSLLAWASQQTDLARMKRMVPLLQTNMLERQVSGLQNAHHEAFWLLELSQAGNWSLHHMLLKGLLKHQLSQRSVELATPDRVSQLIQVQLRVHNALTDGDWPTILRVLGHTYPSALLQDSTCTASPTQGKISASATLAG
jgi:DNA-binding FadR family transcriptional regulator